MWDKLWGYIKQVISVNCRLDDVEEDIAELREKRKEDRQEDERRDEKIDAITQVLQRFALEYEHDRENAANERELQRLRLEVLLLQAGHRPPANQPLAEIETLRELVEKLQRDNVELLRRLERTEQKTD